jgi:PIN domain nuclease of toxin-antitoxin system
MRLLLDTQLLLWSAASSGRLPREARLLLEDPDNEVYFSSASLWEVAAKASLDRAGLDVDLGVLRPALVEMGFAELPVTGAHAERLASLGSSPTDPFDRMLVAQSLSEPLVLLTNDDTLGGSGDLVRVV